MKGIIGKKIGMTQVYSETGALTPVTVIEAGPCVVVDVKTQERDGYSAVQLGFGVRKAKNVAKPMAGHFKKAGLEVFPAQLKEFRTVEDAALELGTEIKADVFDDVEFLDITGTTKGRGFQGVVKRYNFGGGRYSHGGGWKRKPGSIGQCEFPGRVDKGKKMPGQMGNVSRTIQNLKVQKIDVEQNLIFVKGAVPGPNGGTLYLKKSKKK
ncbi:50S ribosomal protein L3 [Lentisphaerota bacterium WC36G]|nr:50S ribosomal protein L3 [Lentisphaerae bacterium WC36]